MKRTTPRVAAYMNTNFAAERIGMDDPIQHNGWDIRILSLKREDVQHLLDQGALEYTDGEYTHLIVLEKENQK